MANLREPRYAQCDAIWVSYNEETYAVMWDPNQRQEGRWKLGLAGS